MEERVKYGVDHPSVQTERDTIIGRLGNILGELGGCRKALESLVGCPMDGEGRKAADPVCTMVRLEELVEDIASSVREVSHQIDRLNEKLG